MEYCEHPQKRSPVERFVRSTISEPQLGQIGTSNELAAGPSRLATEREFDSTSPNRFATSTVIHRKTTSPAINVAYRRKVAAIARRIKTLKCDIDWRSGFSSPTSRIAGINHCTATNTMSARIGPNHQGATFRSSKSCSIGFSLLRLITKISAAVEFKHLNHQDRHNSIFWSGPILLPANVHFQRIESRSSCNKQRLPIFAAKRQVGRSFRGFDGLNQFPGR